ncbi:MAG: ATP phosphoribosyltransferase [Bdellovibrionales bacterium]
MTDQKFIFAIPKGRIWEQLEPMMSACGIIPEDDFTNPKSRKLQFSTNIPNLDIIRVRAFDVATFVAYGGAHLGVVGSDVIEEFDYDELYAPVNLKIGACRLSVAVPKDKVEEDARASHIRIATKYPNLTTKYYAQKGVQAECIKLNGAMEIAPALGLANSIVDLVETGSTLKANNLIETDEILQIESKLIVNRTALKTNPETVGDWVEKFRKAV